MFEERLAKFARAVAVMMFVAVGPQAAMAALGPDLPDPEEGETPALILMAPVATQQTTVDELKSFRLAFSDSHTSAVTRRLGDAERECGALPAEYRADCLAQGFRSAASATGNRPDYTTAQSELNKASRSLSSLVSQNEDKAAAPIRKGGKTYRAVKKAAVKAVAAKAVAIVTETETKLLRSASGGLRKTHYARIAQAVGSTKKILRS
ncbi:MAG: hypothetical protein KDJ66_16255 [Nitratireductor sp.]|nr:hypothetical protein [Nitratireductor sp.]MCB1455234.1 hypothetical protein [Nitratireductor sp.]